MDDMQLIGWDESLETGIEIIDEQHKEFMKRANHFFLAFMVEKKSDAVLRELDFLESYLYNHFQTEEVFQRECNYPDFPVHFEEHKRLVEKVKEVKEIVLSMNDTNSMECYAKFVDLVNLWIGEHIMDSDKRFSQYYKAMSK